ncbi:tetratricopeptide repeat protein [Paenibacillus tianmuensis]|uniref:tetratricopeptide repeat protein n=1 Tax=Paenibacillus tianmuensis TaxID=624147 RepID=UPI000B820DEC|nr:tetratricopeptide repeat protein [Paenibacillus tianmuensis]
MKLLLYEENLEKGFDGSFPYDRLSIIYRRQGKFADEIRILEKAISVFEKVNKQRPDRDHCGTFTS